MKRSQNIEAQEAYARPFWPLLNAATGPLESTRLHDAGYGPDGSEGSVDSLVADDAVGYLDLADAALAKE